MLTDKELERIEHRSRIIDGFMIRNSDNNKDLADLLSDLNVYKKALRAAANLMTQKRFYSEVEDPYNDLLRIGSG